MKLFLFILIIFSKQAYSQENVKVTLDGEIYIISIIDIDRKLSWDDAKLACENHIENNKEDWVLPSRSVLEKMDNKKDQLGLETKRFNSAYWGSDEKGSIFAYIHFFNNEDKRNSLYQTQLDALYWEKAGRAYVRCVRKVK